MFGGDDSDSLSQISMMASPLQYTLAAPEQQQQQHQQTTTQPQWSQEETREFIRIRAELERDFTVAKRNKTLWEVVSARMRERGYRRTPDQCKCKWKNLLNRYKGSETSDPENSRQCPFFEELHALFSERAKNMQRLRLESERASAHAKKKSKKVSGDRSSDEPSEDEDDDEEETDEERPVRDSSRKRKAEKPAIDKPGKSQSGAQRSASGGDICELLKEFFEQQQKMEMQMREMMERRAQERLLFEQEWRQTMEKLERERLMVEQAWREREEQRRSREESRAERRDALLTTLLNKLIHEQ
ncbi:trihelix transcription factor GT-3b-like [Punica granatum]|uniref:Uncharacterized protein n=2 Tax=Punica granatum TaxID=22663 RepID=A0A2I0IJ23_PUNGR|nr:trihelix transcription factor GT-3b-like [Punica granatum]PKI44031.1 hypothetical protein CRG98_035561 [Punica granatum]